MTMSNMPDDAERTAVMPIPEGEDGDWPEEMVVTNAAAIALATDRRSLKYLQPFLRQTHTLTSAAGALETSASTLAYWVPRLVASGLVEARGARRRAGRAMPTYRAAARSFVISHRNLPISARIALFDGGRFDVMNKMLDGIDEELARNPDIRFRVYAPEVGSLALHSIEDDAFPTPRPFTDNWMSLRLDEDDAVEFVARLDALCEEFGARRGRRVYVAHVGLVREPRHRWRASPPVT